MSEPTLFTACGSCGAPVAAGGPAGHCPVCLLERICDEEDEVKSSGDEPWARLGGYDLFEEIGRGGMGVVYRARQRDLGRIVAVKVLLDAGFASDAQKERFRREAEAVAKLMHPAIVSIHETGESDGLPWFSMDYLEGPGLEQRVRQSPPSGRESANLLREIADAVAHAHSRGILHRDLKPSNVLLDAAGRPHITDFGIAVDRFGRTTPDPGLTRTGQSLGSPGYAAPELVQGGKADERSDVYGLGAILYHLLTGRPPYQGTTLGSILRQVREDDPVMPSRLVPGVSRDLETIAMKCLRKDPGDRYENAVAFGEDLGRWLEGAPVKARPLGPVRRAMRWCRRRPALATLAAATCLLVAVVTGGSLAYAKRQGELERRAMLLAEARKFNASTDAGARGEAIATLREAWRIAPSGEIRSEAIAALSRPDWSVIRTEPSGDPGEAIDDPMVSGDGSRRIHFADGGIEVIDPATGRLDCRFDGYSAGAVASLDDTGSRLALARAGDVAVKILSIPDGGILATLGHPEPVTGLDWSGELIATGCANRFVQIWDPQGRLRHRFVGHEAARLMVRFRPGSADLASISEDRIVRLWHAGRGVELLSAFSQGWNGPPVVWSFDGTKLFYSSHNGLERRGLELRSPVNVRVLTLPEDLPGPEGLATMDLSHSGNLVSTSDDGFCHLRETATGRILARIPKGAKEWVVTRFSPDGNTLWLSGWDRGCTPYPIVRENGGIRLGQPGEPLFGTGNLLRAISRDGGTFVLGNNARETFVVAKRSGGNPVHLKQAAVLSAAISPDGVFVATSNYARSGVKVWRLPEGRIEAELAVPGTSAEFWFSQDGGTLTVCSSEGALRYRTRDWTIDPAFPRGVLLEGAVPLPDRGMIACRDGQSVVLRDATSLEVRSRMPVPALAGWMGRAQLACSGDGTTLAARAASGTITVWNLPGLQAELETLGFK
jgi:WD40 repeat protein